MPDIKLTEKQKEVVKLMRGGAFMEKSFAFDIYYIGDARIGIKTAQRLIAVGIICEDNPFRRIYTLTEKGKNIKL